MESAAEWEIRYEMAEHDARDNLVQAVARNTVLLEALTHQFEEMKRDVREVRTSQSKMSQNAAVYQNVADTLGKSVSATIHAIPEIRTELGALKTQFAALDRGGSAQLNRSTKLLVAFIAAGSSIIVAILTAIVTLAVAR